MTIEIRSLKEVSVNELLEVFNDAFSDYILPMKLTAEVLAFKLHSELIDLASSVGAFEQEKLVAFMLTGMKSRDTQMLYYNAGTGVIPAYRGQRLVAKMYAYGLPLWKQNVNSGTLQLEVIKGNDKAIRAYESEGYRIERDLYCFKGEPNEVQYTVKNILIKDAESVPWDIFKTFWDITPSWQNDIAVLEQIHEDVCYTIAEYDYKIVGYIAYHKNSGKIFQMAVSKNYRGKGIGELLINEVVNKLKKPILITNIDSKGVDIIAFFKSIQLVHYVTQHEMVRPL